VQRGNVKTVLAITDRNAMAHAIEARVPYLDHRIVECVFQLPDSYKAGHGLRKRLLRRIACRYLPQSVLQRRDRIGFGTPAETWLKASFRDELFDTVQSTMFRTSPLFDQARLTAYVDDFYTGRHHDAAALWRLYALAQWATVYNLTLA
jgi:asparagine synthase (glutamine-hydrolysing)